MAREDLIPLVERYPDRTTSGSRPYARVPGFYQYLTAIRDTLNRALPTYATGYLRPRGLLIPIDTWLRGTLRWARKLGGSAAVWRPELRMQLDEPTGSSERTFYVNLIPDSLMIGTILEVSPIQLASVVDFNLQDFTVTIGQELDVKKEAGEYIKVFAWPVGVEGPFASGSTQIRVSTSLPLARGDRLQVPINANESLNFQFTTPHNVIAAEFIEEDVEGEKYLLTLEQPLSRDVTGDETIYMRAFPGYFSNRVALPDYSAAFLKLVGPFLIDFLSGPLTVQTQAEEFVNIRQFRSDRTPVTPLLASEHNGQVNRMPIRAEQMLFWNVIKGDLNHDGVNAIATCDDDGLFRVVDRLSPHMDTQEFYASGAIVAVAKANLANNESFDVHDGINLRRFEFQVDGTFVAAPGKIGIDIQGLTTDEEVAAAIATAIVNSVLNLDVTRNGRVVNLVNRSPGALGNIPMSESVADTGFIVEGMAGGGGGITWMINVQSDVEAELRIRFHPNPDVLYNLTVGANTILVNFEPSYQPATHLDIRVTGEAARQVKFSTWSLHGSRISYIETKTVVRVETDQWAGSFLVLKPLWPNFDQLKPFPDIDMMSNDSLLL